MSDRIVTHLVRYWFPAQVWCSDLGWGVATVDEFKADCPECLVRFGLSKWEIEDYSGY